MNLRSKTAGRIINIVLVALLLTLVFVPDAKSWVMRQMMGTGLFNAKIDNEVRKDSAANKPITDFSMTDSTGNTIRVSDLKGKVVFINFWATWCPPCRAEMPSLAKLVSEFQDDPDILFMFVSEDEDLQKATEYLAGNKYNFPLYQLRGAAPASVYKGTLPTTVILDKTGNMIYHHEGMANYNASDFIAKLRSLK